MKSLRLVRSDLYIKTIYAMKIIRLMTILCLHAIVMSAQAIVPKTETTCHWMRVTDVERTDSSTRVGVRLQNYPRYWVIVDSAKSLISSKDPSLRYKLTGTENLELDKKIWMPETGYHEGVLIFEKVPADVKVVDLAGTDTDADEIIIYGINLDEPHIGTRPDIITLSDIIGDGNKTSTEWSGLDPNRYADLGFYDKEGMTHIRGRITDYSPKYGVSTYSIRTKDDFTNVEKVNVGDINPDGTFGIDIPLAYPQSDYFQLGDINRNLFLIPGDTLSIVTCLAQTIDPKQGYVPEHWGFEGSLSDGAVINMLVDSLYNKYDLNSMYKKYGVKNTDSIASDTYRQNERLAALLDSVLTDIHGFIGNLPVSEFAKDVLTSLAIGQIYGQTEENQLTFRLTKGAAYKRDADSNLVANEPELLDEATILNPWMKHRDLIYNNPLLVSHGWMLPNRWKFNSQFLLSNYAAKGMEEVPGDSGYQVYQEAENLSKTYSRVIDRLDSIGLGNCFIAQFVRTSTLIDNLNKDTDPSSEKLQRQNRLASQVIKHNDYDSLNEILMAELNDYVGKVMIAENRLTDSEDNGMSIPDTPEGKVLSRIIDPYKGNVLYLDFWGIGCGPCRAGMMDQKPLLEKLADRPFRALYIAEADQMEACKEWLEKEGIKGEHLFISQDDWKRLTGLFNFSAIPFGVLIGRDGKILKTHYNLYEEEPLHKKALEE